MSKEVQINVVLLVRRTVRRGRRFGKVLFILFFYNMHKFGDVT